ncbi:MAG: response regulator transcription factor [Chitinophagaceae bacterium]|jgi:DNA-binding NarL/FixJ family response regulator
MISDNPVKIYICDDHILFAESLKAFFSLTGEFEVIGYASNIMQAYDDILLKHPTIVLIDYQLKTFNGLDLLKKIKSSKIKCHCFILTMKNDLDLKIRAMEIGASGYLLKEISCEEMVDIFQEVLFNHRGFVDSTDILKSESMHSVKSILTKRETEIALLVCKGLSSNEIANKLHLSVLTVSTHRKHILKKLNVKNPLELLHKMQQ